MKNPKSCLQDVYDTIVIGGGIAGLTSALELSKSGANVIVLEAESYPGGRVRTIRYDGQYAEAGAMVVTEEENTLLSLLKDLSINSLVELGSHGVELFIGSKFVRLSSMDGQIRKISDLRGLFEFFIAALTSRNPKLPFPTPNLFLGFRKALRSMKTQAEFINYPYRPGARIGWDTQTFGEFLNQFHPGLRPYFDLWMKVTAGELTDHISLFWGLVTFYWNINSTFSFIKGGTSLLPERIATLLKDRLCLNS